LAHFVSENRRPLFRKNTQKGGSAMNVMLTVALMAACMVNVACLFGHL